MSWSIEQLNGMRNDVQELKRREAVTADEAQELLRAINGNEAEQNLAFRRIRELRAQLMERLSHSGNRNRHAVTRRPQRPGMNTNELIELANQYGGGRAAVNGPDDIENFFSRTKSSR